jgi:hypothetical protein
MFRARAVITRRDGRDEPGQQRELAPQHIAHHRLLSAVETGLGNGVGLSGSHDFERRKL